MSAPQEDHRDRMVYRDFIEALEDADKVVADLARLADGQLLVPATDIEFTIRRARQLLRSVTRQAVREGIS